jgi:hypothetical protein
MSDSSDECKCLIQKLSNVEVKEWYQVKVSNRSVTLENCDDKVDINKACYMNGVGHEN